jgi:hypothetical protein
MGKSITNGHSGIFGFSEKTDYMENTDSEYVYS